MPRTSHVLVVGIDGVRYDTLRRVDTPALDAIERQGLLRPVLVDESSPTVSGPCWATIVTGVLPADHGITDNDFTAHRLAEHPDVVRLTREQRPDVATFVAAGWGPLVKPVDGGPLLADGGWFPEAPTDEALRFVDPHQAHLPDEWQHADQAVTDAGIAFVGGLTADTPSLTFVYLGGPDEVCHLVGTGPAYDGFVEDSDRRLGELMAAIAHRPSRADEDWTVLVVTDHGHVDAGGHGGDSLEERTAWLAAVGPTVPRLADPAPELHHADVAAHVHAVLGLAASDAVVGVPLGTRR